jgi:hypothetical protein
MTDEAEDYRVALIKEGKDIAKQLRADADEVERFAEVLAQRIK